MFELAEYICFLHYLISQMLYKEKYILYCMKIRHGWYQSTTNYCLLELKFLKIKI